jgi:hypothetical protein
VAIHVEVMKLFLLTRMIQPERFDRYIRILPILVGAILFIRTVISRLPQEAAASRAVSPPAPLPK